MDEAAKIEQIKNYVLEIRNLLRDNVEEEVTTIVVTKDTGIIHFKSGTNYAIFNGKWEKL